MARKKGKVKTDHEKAEDFKRLSAKKANSIARAARNLGKMASTRYVYTPAQVKALAAFVQAEIESAFAAFDGKQTTAGGFSFD